MMILVKTPSQFFYTHAAVHWLIFGLVITLIGMFVGWLAWRHGGAEAKRVEADNEKIARNNQRIENEVTDLKVQVDDLKEATR